MAVRSANGQSRDKISLCARTGAWGKESPRFGLIFRESCYHILLVAPSRLFPSLPSFIPFHLRPLRPVSHFLLSRFSEPSSSVLPSRSPSSHRRLFAALVETGPLDSIVRRLFCLLTLRRGSTSVSLVMFISRRATFIEYIYIYIYIYNIFKWKSNHLRLNTDRFHSILRDAGHTYRVRTRKREERITRVDR